MYGMTFNDRPPGDDLDPDRSSPAPRWALGPEWASSGLRQPGWVLLPLRVFLGVTFIYAGLQKLATPSFFDPSSPTSVQHQMQMVAPTSPIGFLVRWSLHAGLVVGVLIAVAELAVGVGTLLGLKARLAAVGGALLALTFFLTMSWTTSPYYYGADIVFLFAWTPFVLVGSADVMSLDAWLHHRVPTPGLAGASGTSAAPVEGSPAVHARQRRAIVLTGGATVLAAALTTLLGRLASAAPVGHARQAARAAGPSTRPSAPPSPHKRKSGHPSTGDTAPARPSGTRIAAARAVPVGKAASFSDPASGVPAWLVRLAPKRCVAFSAVCTHAGCTVEYQASTQEFVCPCHGGTYSARTGQVLAGPPPAPLREIPARIADGQIYVD